MPPFLTKAQDSLQLKNRITYKKKQTNKPRAQNNLKDNWSVNTRQNPPKQCPSLALFAKCLHK